MKRCSVGNSGHTVCVLGMPSSQPDLSALKHLSRWKPEVQEPMPLTVICPVVELPPKGLNHFPLALMVHLTLQAAEQSAEIHESSTGRDPHGPIRLGCLIQPRETADKRLRGLVGALRVWVNQALLVVLQQRCCLGGSKPLIDEPLHLLEHGQQLLIPIVRTGWCCHGQQLLLMLHHRSVGHPILRHLLQKTAQETGWPWQVVVIGNIRQVAATALKELLGGAGGCGVQVQTRTPLLRPNAAPDSLLCRCEWQTKLP